MSGDTGGGSPGGSGCRAGRIGEEGACGKGTCGEAEAWLWLSVSVMRVWDKGNAFERSRSHLLLEVDVEIDPPGS